MDEVEVEFHKDTYDDYIAPIDRMPAGFSVSLLDDFKRYKGSFGDHVPSYFGRDAFYHYPPDIANCLQHIHLCIPPRKFRNKIPQYDRTCRKDQPEHDIALVYAQNKYDLHKYTIIGVLTPDAHAAARNMTLMRKLGGLARACQNKFLD